MPDYALIVGVEEYATMSRLQGPALDALRLALWLHRKQGVPSANILLFLNKCDAWEGELEKEYETVRQNVSDCGIAIRDVPSFGSVRAAWRQDLPAADADGGTLWLYWSGHGITFPGSRQAVFCCDTEFNAPAYLYVEDFRNLLRTPSYQQFSRQRLIVDACSVSASFDDLRIGVIQAPLECKGIKEDCDSLLLNAVAPGRTAEAEEAGGLFTRVLLQMLDAEGSWPEKTAAFCDKLADEIVRQANSEKLRPQLWVRSPLYQYDPPSVRRRKAYTDDLIDTLRSCAIPLQEYQPHYLRTIGSVLADPDARNASSLSSMVENLADLKEEPEYGGYPQLLMEFLLRVGRAFPADTAALRDWLAAELPASGRLTLERKLQNEDSNLVLHIVLIEFSAEDPYPVTMEASLSDAAFHDIIRSHRLSELRTSDELHRALHKILMEARQLALKSKVELAVTVFANPPLLCLPFHAIPVDEDDDTLTFGDQHPFVLRSRARLDADGAYDLDSWREKAKKLSLEAADHISLEPVSGWSSDIGDKLAAVNGMLVLEELPEKSVGKPYRLLRAALRKGLPLLSWRTVDPPGGDWGACNVLLKTLLQPCRSVEQAPRELQKQRRSKPWARQTVLLWDTAEVPPFLITAHEEPIQE